MINYLLVCDGHVTRDYETILINAKSYPSNRLHWLVVATIVALITMCSIVIRKNDLISCAICPEKREKYKSPQKKNEKNKHAVLAYSISGSAPNLC